MTQEMNPFLEGTRGIVDHGGGALWQCFQCGTCTGTCPWNLVRSFEVRRTIHACQLGLVDLEARDAWLCVTCGACVERCPRGVTIIDVMRAMRRLVVEFGGQPKQLSGPAAATGSVGNPWGEPREKRGAWAEGLGVKPFTRGTEYLYFPCCTPAYDSRCRKVARATAKLLQAAGIDFGILGDGESCCSESVRKAGSEDVFQQVARANIEVFEAAGVDRILCTSPHCLETFTKEYPELGARITVVHLVQLLLELVREGRLELTNEIAVKVAYHDPCYLGRHNGIYEEPRELLRRIPAVELVELPDNHEDSLCCGGGGGGLWREVDRGERFSHIRAQQAMEVEADVLAVACPYCLIQLEDAVASVEGDRRPVVKDVAELVAESAGC